MSFLRLLKENLLRNPQQKVKKHLLKVRKPPLRAKRPLLREKPQLKVKPQLRVRKLPR
jgi:hypothetical protein